MKRFLRSKVVLTLITLVLLVGAITIPLSGTTKHSHAAADVLILSTTVTNGTNSLEAQAAQALGLTVNAVDPSTWGSMTTADFASYKAIVLGDPTCAEDTSPIAPAEANTSTWGPAIKGNVVVIGTDPVFHAGSQSGAQTLISNGIAFATSTSGKTGAYIDLSCYYYNAPSGTAVPVLNGIASGGFTVEGQGGCPNNSHIVGTSPVVTGLTDASLSNWGCSTHEGFVTWPSSFQVQVISEDIPSSFVAPDGTTGAPYILTQTATVTALGGTWISPGNSFTITGNILHFAAHAYGGAGVDHVNFTAWWQGVNPKIWAIACTVTSPTPGTTDVYECDWTSSATLPNGSLRMNLAGVPRGPITVSFDVYGKAGSSILAPNGTRQGTMQTGWGQAFSYPIGVPDKSGLRQPTDWGIEQGFNVPNDFYQVCATLRQSDGSADCYHTGEDWQKKVNGVLRGDVTAGQNVYPIAPGRLTFIHTTGTYPGDVIMLEHQTPRGLVYSMYAHVSPSASLLNAWNQGQHPYISSIKTPIATIVPWPGDITNSHLHFEIRGFFSDDDVIHNGVFDQNGGCGCVVGPGYWLWSRGGPEAKGWLRPSLVITDSRQ